MDNFLDNIVGFDTETTGVDTASDRIVTASVVSQVGGEQTISEWLINPGVPIPQGAIDVHGITNEKAASGADPSVAVLEIKEKLVNAKWVTVYNASYDINLLNAELVRYGHEPLPEDFSKKVIDPLVLDRKLDKYRRGSRNLEMVSRHYGFTPDPDALHNATFDVITTLETLKGIVKKYPYLLEYAKSNRLYEFQRQAHRDWATGFNKWKGSNVANPEWI